MATVHHFLPSKEDFLVELQERTDFAENVRYKRFKAAMVFITLSRKHLIRKHIALLSRKATIIQCAFRNYRARKAYRAALRRAVRNKHERHYARAATIIQVLLILLIFLLNAIKL